MPVRPISLQTKNNIQNTAVFKDFICAEYSSVFSIRHWSAKFRSRGRPKEANENIKNIYVVMILDHFKM